MCPKLVAPCVLTATRALNSHAAAISSFLSYCCTTMQDLFSPRFTFIERGGFLSLKAADARGVPPGPYLVLEVLWDAPKPYSRFVKNHLQTA